MLSKKYFQKINWGWRFQDALSYCAYCEHYDDCESRYPKECVEYKTAKSKLQHLIIWHESFESAIEAGIRGVLNASRTLFIVPGCQSPSLFTNVPYLKINRNNFRQVFKYGQGSFKKFVQESMIMEGGSRQGISRENLYFAFKCLNGGVEFFAPLDYIRNQNSALYCLRNDRLTIYIAPTLEYIKLTMMGRIRKW